MPTGHAVSVQRPAVHRHNRCLQVALNDSAASLVVTFDVSGRGQAIHPLDKFDVTRRIADAILAQAGMPALASGPTFQKVNSLWAMAF